MQEIVKCSQVITSLLSFSFSHGHMPPVLSKSDENHDNHVTTCSTEANLSEYKVDNSVHFHGMGP